MRRATPEQQIARKKKGCHSRTRLIIRPKQPRLIAAWFCVS